MKRKNFLFSLNFFIYFALTVLFQGATAKADLPEGAIARLSQGDSVFTVAFSPDGKTLASGGDDNAIILWDLPAYRKQKSFTEHSDSVMSVAFSPDGQLLASASLDGFVRLWDVSKQRRHTTFAHTHTGWVKSVAFSPDGKILASGGGDQQGSIMLWDVPKNHRIRAIPGHSGIVESIAFSPDGQKLASTSRDKTAKLWYAEELQLRKTLRKHQNVVYAVEFSPDAKLLATSSRDNTVKLWNVASGESVASFFVGGTRYVYAEALAFSPDGKYLALGCVDHSIILWDVEAHSKITTVRGHNGGVTSIAFSPDGSTLASGSRDRTVLLWNLAHFNIIPSEPIPTPQPVPDAIVENTTSPKNFDPKPADSRPSLPDPVVIDTTPPNIVIFSPTESVVPWNTEELLIQGQVSDDNSISEVKVNSQEVRVSAAGKFTTTVPLNKGENEIRVTAADPQGNRETNRFSVIRPGRNPQPLPDPDPDLVPPTIFLNVPTHVETENAEFTVQGSVIDNRGIGEVKVNNMVVSVSPDGDFTAKVRLSYGENEIRVAAADLQGNIDTNRFTLFRKSPPIDTVGPEIRIHHPRLRGIQREIHINAASVAVSGTVTDASGVSEVKVEGTATQRTGDQFTAEVQLTRGNNVIRITARDKHGNGSDKEIVIFRPYSDPILRKGKDYALLFAVQDYDHWTKLHKPVSDAETIQHDLETLYGFETRLIKNPTQAEILETIREFAEMDYTDDDQLFIFFAGHGYFDDTFKGGYLVARDTQLPTEDIAMLSYVSHSVVRDIIDAMNCKHIFLVLDTCYSGTFDRLIAMRGNTADRSPQQLTAGDISRKFQYTTRWYLTSGGKEIVYDASPFVHQFLEALRSKGGSDNILTIDEILSYVRKLVKPKPRASGFGSDEPGSDFLFFSIE